MVSIVQIIIILFAVFALTRAILRLKDNDISVPEFIFWTIIWIAVIITALKPGLLQGIAESTGIQSGINLLVYISVLLLFYLVFRIYVKIDSQDQKFNTLVRQISINNSRKKK